MSEANSFLIRAEEIEKLKEMPFQHPLNPNSEIYLRDLSALMGLQRVILRLGRVPSGKESFIYHAHHHEEEFLYILSERGIAEIDDEEFEVGVGDFLGFPVPCVAHHLRNPFEADLIYLMGGERQALEIGDFPRLGKRIIRDLASGEALRDRDQAYFIDLDSIEDFVPRRQPMD